MEDPAVTNDDIINSLVGRVIVFTAEIKSTENDYAEPGIRARVTEISVDESDKDDQFCTVIVDYSEFDEVNKTFESHDFFNERREPCLTAREAGMYRSTEKIYLPKLRHRCLLCSMQLKEGVFSTDAACKNAHEAILA